MLPATRHRAHRIRFENWRAHDDVDESLVVTRVGPRPSAPTCISPGHDSPTRPVGLRAVAPAGDDAPTYVGHGPEPEDNAITKQLPRIPRGYRPSLPAANQRTLPARRQRMAAADAERAPTLVAPRRKAKALRNRAALELPTQLLVLEHMKLAPTPAHVAEISRSVAFVATELEPEVGRRVLMRVAYGGTAGSAGRSTGLRPLASSHARRLAPADSPLS